MVHAHPCIKYIYASLTSTMRCVFMFQLTKCARLNWLQTSKPAGMHACICKKRTWRIFGESMLSFRCIHSWKRRQFITDAIFLFGFDMCRSENKRFSSRKPLGVYNLKTFIVLHFHRIISTSFAEWLMHLSRVKHTQSLSNFESSINTHQSEFELLYQYITRHSNL